MRALGEAVGSPFGGGIWVMIFSNSSVMPSAFLALTQEASEQSSAMVSSMSCLIASTSALGRSILLSTGKISRWLSIAI